MVSWDEVREHIRQKFVLVVDEPERLGLRWVFPNGDDVQRQYVAPIVAFGRPHVQIVSNVVSINALAAHAALTLNARIPVGALCIADGQILLRAVVPLDGIELSVVDHALNNVAHEATQLRMQAVHTPAPAPYFE